MAASGPILGLFLDLDFTHFNTASTKVTWLGNEQDWHNLYGELIATAKEQGVELRFAVITNKKDFDDIAEQAAISFKPYLSIGNPNMYVTCQAGLEWCLIRTNAGFFYERLEKDPVTTACMHDEPISHFVVAPLQSKVGYIYEIASRHGIAPENCLLLDDTPDIILDAAKNGIQTVSFEEFCPTILKDGAELALYEKLQDPAFIEPIVKAKHQKIREKVQQMIQLAKREQVTHLGSSELLSDEFNKLKNDKDPRDCLYSWGSFRLIVNCFPSNKDLAIEASPKILKRH